MKLIDADALKKVIMDEIPLREWMNRSVPKAVSAMGRLIERIDEQPIMTWDTWHYLDQDDKPTETDDYIVFIRIEHGTALAIASYFAGSDQWYIKNNNTDEPCKPIAWQSVIPLTNLPKEF